MLYKILIKHHVVHDVNRVCCIIHDITFALRLHSKSVWLINPYSIASSCMDKTIVLMLIASVKLAFSIM